MALSSRITKIWLESREHAALLAGIPLDDIPKRVKELRYCDQRGENHPDTQVTEFRNWWANIMFDIDMGLLPARSFSSEDNLPRGGNIYDGDRRWIKKQDMRARLAEYGADDSDIPSEILTHYRDETSEDAAGEGPDDILSREAFGQLMEAIARKFPQYRHGDKPNRSALADLMLEVVPDDMTKSSKRTSQERLKEAYEAWEARKHR